MKLAEPQGRDPSRVFPKGGQNFPMGKVGNRHFLKIENFETKLVRTHWACPTDYKTSPGSGFG